MRFIEDLCPPALLYLIFLVVQVGLDASLGLWVTLTIKVLIGVATVIVLDMFCVADLSVVSWFLVATPFLITALATAISIGTHFDARILGQMKEKFVDKTLRNGDLPENTSSPGRVVKTDSEKEKKD
jgi:hypothetical protein